MFHDTFCELIEVTTCVYVKDGSQIVFSAS